MSLLSAVAFAAFAFSGTGPTVPGSGPYNLPNWPTDKQHAADLEGDIKQGEKFAAEVQKASRPSSNLVYIARVNRIGAELAYIAQTTQVTASYGDGRLNPFPYKFHVLQGDDVNAFSIPGGNVYVYEGLMRFVESDDELASVLGHEISHAEFRHYAKVSHENNKMLLFTLPAIVAAIFTRHPEIAEGVNLGQTAMQSSWSIKAEESADYGGFQYLLHTKYNPVGMLTFMERLYREHRFEHEENLGILQTHPIDKERAETALSRLKSLGIPIKRSQVATSFRVILKDTDKGVDAVFYGHKIFTFTGQAAKDRAETSQDKLNDFYDSVPELFDVTAKGNEIYGSGQLLLTVEPDDAAAAGTTVQQLATTTVRQIKNSLYGLAFRVWDDF